MIQPGSQKRRIWDDLTRTVIFIFGMSMAAFFLFSYTGWVSFAFALLFLIAGGRNMRVAWFPYGKLVDSLFWLGASSIGLIVFLVLYLNGHTNNASAAMLMGVLVGYSIYDTTRTVRFIYKYLKEKEKTVEPPEGEEPPPPA